MRHRRRRIRTRRARREHWKLELLLEAAQAYVRELQQQAAEDYSLLHR